MQTNLENKIDIEECQLIYKALGDEESKYIFEQRLLYSLTGNIEHAHNVIKTTEEGEKFAEILANEKEIYIFGAGIWGKEVAQVWKGMWKGFLDNDVTKCGDTIEGIKIYTPQQILNEKFEGKVLISSRLYYKEIMEQLLQLGIKEQNIINFGYILDKMSVEQYFPKTILPHDKDEVFVDVGSLDAMTATHFINWSGNFKKVFCFEPDVQNIPKCERTLLPYINEGKAELIKKRRMVFRNYTTF